MSLQMDPEEFCLELRCWGSLVYIFVKAHQNVRLKLHILLVENYTSIQSILKDKILCGNIDKNP